MTALGTFFRRNYQPLLLSIQVFVDLAVLQLACWSAFWVGGRIGSVRLEEGFEEDFRLYTRVFALICAVCLVCFNSLKLYSPVKSLLNYEEFKGILKGTVVSFFVFFTLVLLLQHSDQNIMDTEGWMRSVLEMFHDAFRWVDLPFKTDNPSRITMVLAFVSPSTTIRVASAKLLPVPWICQVSWAVAAVTDPPLRLSAQSLSRQAVSVTE